MLARDGFFKIEVFDAEVIRRLVFRNLDRADAVFEKIALLVIDIYGVIQAVYNLRQRARDGFAAVCCAVSAAAGGAGEKQCEREQERRKLFGFSHGKFPFRF